MYSLKTYLIQQEVEMLAKGGDRDSRLAVIRSKIGSVSFQSKIFFLKSFFFILATFLVFLRREWLHMVTMVNCP